MTNSQHRVLSTKANMLWNAAGSVFYLGTQWLITVLVVRLSNGYDEAGILALAMAVSNIFIPIGYYKVRAFQVSDLKGEYSFSDYVGFRVISTSLSFFLLVVYSLITCPENSLLPVLLYGLFSMGPVFVDVIHGEEQKQQRMDGIGISLILRGALSLVGFVVGMYFFQSLSLALALMVISSFAVISVFDIAFLRRTVQIPFKASFNVSKIRSLALSCLPLVVALFFCSATPVIPRQLLSDLLGESALGIYASVASPVLIVQMCAQFLYAPLLTSFASLYQSGNDHAFLSLLGKVFLAIVGISLLLAGLFVGFGEWILTLIFGSSIQPYSYLLIPLLICTSLVALIWFLGDVLIGLRKPFLNLAGYALSFVVTLASMNFCIQTWGMNGVSFTLIAGYGAAFLAFFATIFVTVKKERAHE